MTIVIPQLQLVENLMMALLKTSEAPQLSFIQEWSAHGRYVLMGCLLGPCAQAHCRERGGDGGGHVHKDMAPVI